MPINEGGKLLLDMDPEDVGLSPLDYHVQAEHGHDPLLKFGDLGRDIVRECARARLTGSEIAEATGWGADSLRELAQDIANDGWLNTRKRNGKEIEFWASEQLFESGIWDAHLVWRRQHADSEVATV